MPTRLIGSQVGSGRVTKKAGKTENTRCTVEFVESKPWDYNEELSALCGSTMTPI